MIAGIVLAAGAGTRFGGIKQLAPFRGRPLIEHVLAAMAATPLDARYVVLGANAAEIIAGADLHGAESVLCEEWAAGQSASLRAGVEAAGDAEAAVIALGDQPLLAPAAFRRVLDARGSAAAVRATYGGVPGHPVLLERVLLDRVGGLAGDTGARALLADAEVADVPCDGLGSPADVDTPETLRELEASSTTINPSDV